MDRDLLPDPNQSQRADIRDAIDRARVEWTAQQKEAVRLTDLESAVVAITAKVEASNGYRASFAEQLEIIANSLKAITISMTSFARIDDFKALMARAADELGIPVGLDKEERGLLVAMLQQQERRDVNRAKVNKAWVRLGASAATLVVLINLIVAILTIYNNAHPAHP